MLEVAPVEAQERLAAAEAKPAVAGVLRAAVASTLGHDRKRRVAVEAPGTLVSSHGLADKRCLILKEDRFLRTSCGFWET